MSRILRERFLWAGKMVSVTGVEQIGHYLRMGAQPLTTGQVFMHYFNKCGPALAMVAAIIAFVGTFAVLKENDHRDERCYEHVTSRVHEEWQPIRYVQETCHQVHGRWVYTSPALRHHR